MRAQETIQSLPGIDTQGDGCQQKASYIDDVLSKFLSPQKYASLHGSNDVAIADAIVGMDLSGAADTVAQVRSQHGGPNASALADGSPRAQQHIQQIADPLACSDASGLPRLGSAGCLDDYGGVFHLCDGSANPGPGSSCDAEPPLTPMLPLRLDPNTDTEHLALPPRLPNSQAVASVEIYVPVCLPGASLPQPSRLQSCCHSTESFRVRVHDPAEARAAVSVCHSGFRDSPLPRLSAGLPFAASVPPAHDAEEQGFKGADVSVTIAAHQIRNPSSAGSPRGAGTHVQDDRPTKLSGPDGAGFFARSSPREGDVAPEGSRTCLTTRHSDPGLSLELPDGKRWDGECLEDCGGMLNTVPGLGVHKPLNQVSAPGNDTSYDCGSAPCRTKALPSEVVGAADVGHGERCQNNTPVQLRKPQLRFTARATPSQVARTAGHPGKLQADRRMGPQSDVQQTPAQLGNRGAGSSPMLGGTEDAIEACADDVEGFVDAVMHIADSDSRRHLQKSAPKQTIMRSRQPVIKIAGPQLQFMNCFLAGNGTEAIGDEAGEIGMDTGDGAATADMSHEVRWYCRVRAIISDQNVTVRCYSLTCPWTCLSDLYPLRNAGCCQGMILLFCKSSPMIGIAAGGTTC